MTSLREIKRTAITTAKQTKKTIYYYQIANLDQYGPYIISTKLFDNFGVFLLSIAKINVNFQYVLSKSCEYTGFEEWKFCKVSPLFQTKVLKMLYKYTAK